eukprot:TRINITY_DN9414_c0_g1_i1.p1 TRINITY_DN9414_c0_g1~~TRINITY_DN9414_c0_g1_i1.p1  ORF type:complete len:377 (+),score=54.79 TRINITY_DN9414_c0_g1_i1:1354-2484(+)
MENTGQEAAKRVKTESVVADSANGHDDEEARRLQHRRTEAERRARINTSLKDLRNIVGVGPRTERSEVLDLTVKHISKLNETIKQLQSQVDRLLESNGSTSQPLSLEMGQSSMHLDLTSTSTLDELGSFSVFDLVPAPVHDMSLATSPGATAPAVTSSTSSGMNTNHRSAVESGTCPHRINEIVHFSLHNQRPLSSVVLPENIGLAYISSRPTILDVNDSFCRIIHLPRAAVVGQHPTVMYQTMPDARNFRALKIGLIGGKRHTVRTVERVIPYGTQDTVWVRKTVRRHGAIPPSGSGPPILFGMLILEVLSQPQDTVRLLDDAADFESGPADPLCMANLLPPNWKVSDLSELKDVTCECEAIWKASVGRATKDSQ